MNNKRWIVYIAVLLGLVLSGCGSGNQQTAEMTPLPPVTALEDTVSAESFIQPIRHVQLAFERDGRLTKLLVAEGDTVEAGQVIALLDDTDLRAAVTVAEAALNKAQADLAATEAGPMAEELTKARAAILKAEAELVKVISGPTTEEIAVAQAKVRTRRAELAELVVGSKQGDIEAAAVDILVAEVAVKEAQTTFDEGELAMDSELRAAELEAARQRLAQTKAEFNSVNNGPTVEEIAVARAILNQALVALDKVQATTIPQKIAEAQIKVQEAEVNLALLLAGATNEEIAIKAVSVSKAELALQKAVAALEETKIKAPFAGVVTDLPFEPEEFVKSGTPALTMADFSEWKIETDDLTEIDVVSVQVGQQVAVHVDALPEETFSGTVTRIKPQAETKAGDVTYTVDITLNEPGATDPRLRWGMTVNVDIAVESL